MESSQSLPTELYQVGQDCPSAYESAVMLVVNAQAEQQERKRTHRNVTGGIRMNPQDEALLLRITYDEMESVPITDAQHEHAMRMRIDNRISGYIYYRDGLWCWSTVDARTMGSAATLEKASVELANIITLATRTAQERATDDYRRVREMKRDLHVEMMRSIHGQLLDAIQNGQAIIAYSFARLVFHHGQMILQLQREIDEINGTGDPRR